MKKDRNFSLFHSEFQSQLPKAQLISPLLQLGNRVALTSMLDVF